MGITQSATLRISDPAVIGSLESDCDEYFQNHSFETPIIIDMSQVTFIEITSMLHLAQLFYKRERCEPKLVSRMILPTSPTVMMTLHTWRFFEIIEELTDKSISEFILGQGYRFPEVKFQIEGKTFFKDINTDYFDKYYDDKGIQILVKKGFFSLVCIPFKTTQQKRLAVKSNRLQWRADKLISDVLERNLLNHVEIGNVFANTIIYECLTNAARHPKSACLVIGSFFDFKKPASSVIRKPKNAHFTIVLWEDGTSIIDTLKQSIFDGENVRSQESFDLAKKNGLTAWFKLKRSYETSSRIDSLYYDYLPAEHAEDDEILLSSFLPGISRDPERKYPLFEQQGASQENETSTQDDPEELYGPGLGLTFLLDSVVGRLKGSVSVRTKEYFLNIKQGNIHIRNEFQNTKNQDVEQLYQAKLTRHTRRSDGFMGNMITIRIPLEYKI